MAIVDKSTKLYIGNKIKQLRVNKKVSQIELGKVLGVQNNTVSAYERGVALPDIEALGKIANYFNVDVDSFFPKDNVISKSLSETEHFTVKQLDTLNRIAEALVDINESLRDDFLNNLEIMIEVYKLKGKI